MQIQGNVPKPAGPEARPSACPADRTAFPPESGCKDTHSCGTGKQNKGLFLKKIREDRQNRCHTGQYTEEIIRGKEGREGNGHIYYIIYTHGRRRERERKGTDTGTERRNPGRKGWEKDGTGKKHLFFLAKAQITGIPQSWYNIRMNIQLWVYSSAPYRSLLLRKYILKMLNGLPTCNY